MELNKKRFQSGQSSIEYIVVSVIVALTVTSVLGIFSDDGQFYQTIREGFERFSHALSFAI
jgi:hypothetical protein